MKAVLFLMILLLCGCSTYRPLGPKMLGYEYMTSVDRMPNGRGCEVMTESYDDMEDESWLRLINPVVLDNGFEKAVLDVRYGAYKIFKEVPSISIRMGGSICVGEEDVIILKFSDDNTVRLYNQSSYNCSGRYSINLSLVGLGKVRRKLLSQYITKIRLYYLDTYADFDLSPGDQNMVFAALNCVM